MYQKALLILATIALCAGAQKVAEYDYVVVGSGPGGGPLACDLARAGYSTLLLEAGDDQGDNPTYANLGNFEKAGSDVLSRWDFWVKHSDDQEREHRFHKTTWQLPNGTYYIGLDPPKEAKRLGKQYPRSATLGGCAMHNAGVCSLPQDEDWNIIVNKTGDASWTAQNMRKYLAKIEKNLYAPTGSAAHGFDGWLSTTDSDLSWTKNESLPATKIMKELAKLLGHKESDATTLAKTDILGDYPNRDQISSLYSMVQHQDRAGKRSSPNNYIKATLSDPKKYPLTVQLNSLVTRVLFANGTKLPTAIGVEVMTGQSLYKADPRHKVGTKGQTSRIMAKREVIVSGGTFNTPQILKLSGIGPAEELKKFGIAIVKELPGVGENMADNYEGSIIGIGQTPAGTFTPVGAPGLTTAIFKTSSSPKNRNIYTWCGPFSFEGFWPGFPENHGPNQYECAMVHIGPKSQAGYVHLTSADPQDVPDINLNFFKNNGDQDLQEIVEGANLLRKSWQAAGSTVLPFNELHPCPGTGAGNCTDAAQREYIRDQTYSHHATSTCAIGGENDRMAVLDNKFRVRGVRNLRVVDASAFPVVPGAFPVLPTYMISAKAAEDILAEAKNQS
ncbi:alcohol oxidase [Microthyrium microscopicum]|uniref:Alcohol oxidase n=1 Tax=Microthyrium microscopicum TaxID=703497 RepID=A0A6A6U6P6_9PEZI|nr:alcohol oxidase [Microthyrium microscopicum]